MSEQTSAAGSAAAGVTIDEIGLADEPDRWRELGFSVDGDLLALGTIRLRLVGREAGKGIVGWSLRGAASSELDGLPTEASTSLSRASPRHGTPTG